MAVTEVEAAGEMVVLAVTTLNHRHRRRRHCHHTRSLWEGEATGGVVGMERTAAAAAQGKVDRGATATVGVGGVTVRRHLPRPPHLLRLRVLPLGQAQHEERGRGRGGQDQGRDRSDSPPGTGAMGLICGRWWRRSPS